MGRPDARASQGPRTRRATDYRSGRSIVKGSGLQVGTSSRDVRGRGLGVGASPVICQLSCLTLRLTGSKPIATRPFACELSRLFVAGSAYRFRSGHDYGYQRLLLRPAGGSTSADQRGLVRLKEGHCGICSVHSAMRCAMPSPLTPRTAPAPSRWNNARVTCRIHSFDDISESSLEGSPLMRTKPFRSPPCASRKTGSNDWMTPDFTSPVR